MDMEPYSKVTHVRLGFIIVLIGLVLLFSSGVGIVWAEEGPQSKRRVPADIQNQFHGFARMWLNKLSKNLLGKADVPAIIDENGQYVVRFYRLKADSLHTQVDRLCSGSAYIGILRYDEYLYQSKGRNLQMARRGPYEVVKRLRVTEFFLFRDGDWIVGFWNDRGQRHAAQAPALRVKGQGPE